MVKKHAVNAARNCAISYSILIVGHLVLSLMGIWGEMDNERVLQLTIICFSANFLEFLTSFIQIENIYVELVIRYVELFVVVSFMTMKVFPMVEFVLSDMLYLVLILAVICFGCCVFTYYSDLCEAGKINEIINNKNNNKKKKKNN